MKEHAGLNRFYRHVWCYATQTWLVAPETARRSRKGGSTSRTADAVVGTLASFALSGILDLTHAQQAPPVAQLPMAGVVSRGNATISQSSTATSAAMTVLQSTERAVINWSSFNIGANARVNFVQPDRNSVTLNKVVDPTPSQIFGQISANGQVYLSNPHGVYFSPTSQVDVGALVATSHQLDDDAFMAGKADFARNQATGKVINEGRLTATLGGYIALLAPEVQNAGVIVARAGTVVLAAGDLITLNFDGNQGIAGITTTPSTISALIENRLAISAPDGKIIFSAFALNKLQAGVIKNSGTLEASSLVQRGGKILLEGNDIRLAATSQIFATGPSGGGTVLVGGDWQGAESLRQATSVTMETGAVIDASATSQGDGGKVVLWTDVKREESKTEVAGSIKADAGPLGGDGGDIDTSGHRLIIDRVRIYTRSRTGRYGRWLLDPYTYTINSANANTIASALANSNVMIDTNAATSGGISGVSGAANIVVNADIVRRTGGGGATTLTLSAGQDIYVNANISGTSGKPLNVVLAARAHGEATGSVYVTNAKSIQTFGGDITIGGGDQNASGSAITSASQNPMAAVSIVGILDATTDGSGATQISKAKSDVVANTVSVASVSNAAGGGNISIRGQGSSTLSTNNWGVRLAKDTSLSDVGIITGGAGTISITGTGGNGSSSSAGIQLDAGGYVLANQGSINLTGAQGSGSSAYGIAAINSAKLVGTQGGLELSGESLLVDGTLGFVAGITSNIHTPIVTQGVSPILALRGSGAYKLWGDANAWNNARPANTAATGTAATFYNDTNPIQLMGISRASAFYGFGTLPAGLVTDAYYPIYVKETFTASNYGNLILGYQLLDSAGNVITPGVTPNYSLVNAAVSGTASYNLTNSSAAGVYTALYTGGLSVADTTGKYFLLPYAAGTSYTVKPLPLTFNGTRFYDGTLAVNASDLTITNRVGNDDVTVSGSVSNALGSKNASTAPQTMSNFTGMTVSNANYTLTGAMALVTVRPLNVFVSGAVAADKVYDRSTAATVSGGTVAGFIVSGESLSLNQAGSFAIQDVVMTNGTPQPIFVIPSFTLVAGANTLASNYSLTQPSLSATITPKPLTISTVPTVSDKVYDGNTIASIRGGQLSGVINGDTVTLSQAGNFVTPDAGSNKEVETKFFLTGSSATNYSVVQPTGLKASITPAPLTVRANNDAKFSAEADAVGYAGVHYSGFVNGETASNLSGTLTLARSNANTNAEGFYSNVIEPSGLTSNNYSITFAKGNYTIAPADQLLVRLNTSSIAYGAEPTYSVASAQYLHGTVQTIAPSNIEVNGNTISVTDDANKTTTFTLAPVGATQSNNYYNAGGYSIEMVGSSIPNGASFNSIAVMGSLNVSRKPLTVITPAATLTKVFDNTNVMTNLTAANNYGVSGLVGVDLVSLSGQGTYNTTNAGSGIGYTISNIGITGAASNNYYLSNVSNTSGNGNQGPTLIGTTGVITQRPILLAGGMAYSGVPTALGMVATNVASGAPVIVSGTGNLSSKDAGIVTITGVNNFALDNPNYYLDTSTPNNLGSYSIIPTILSISGSRAYDGTTVVNGATLQATGVNGETFSVSGSGGVGNLLTKNVGTGKLDSVLGLQAIEAVGGPKLSNYFGLSPTFSTYTVSKLSAGVSQVAQSVGYNGTLQMASVTQTGFIAGDNVQVTGQSSGTNAGNYMSSLGVTGTDANNYQVAFTDGKLTIGAIPITVNINVSKTYDASTAFSSGFSITNNVWGLTSPYFTGSAFVASANAGSYTSFSSNSLVLTNTNYTIASIANVQATINKADLTISGTQTYNAQTSAIASGMQATGVAGQSFYITGLGDSSNLLSKNVGAQTLNSLTGLSLGGVRTGGDANNYNTLSAVNSSITINRANLTITGESVANKPYDGAMTASLDKTNAVLSGVWGADQVTLSSAAASASFYDKNVATAKSVYTFGHSLTGNDAGNYNLIQPTFSANITAVPLTLTANNGSKTYGQGLTLSNTAFTATGLQPGDSVGSVTLTSAGASATAAASANPYNIVPSAAIGSSFLTTNYNISYVNGNLMVNPANLTVTANNGAKTYGLSYSLSDGAFATTGLQNGETVGTVSLTSLGATSTANVGTYSIVPSALTGGNFNSNNYNISYTNGTLTVNPATLTITAKNGSKTYGETYALLGTDFTVTGLKNNESVGSVTLNTSGAVNTTTIGSYAITPSAATGGTFTASNYNIGYVNGTLTVNPLLLTISGETAANKVYNGNTAATIDTAAAALVGIFNADDVTLVKSSVTGTFSDRNVGDNKAVTVVGNTLTGAKASNYILQQPMLTASISASPLTITANDGSKTYGQSFALQGTAFTSNGLQGSDVISSVTMSSLGAASGAGVGASPYAITPSAATGNPFNANNYAITYVPGRLTVNPANLTVTANNLSKNYGQAYAFAGIEFTSSGLQGTDRIDTVTLSSAGAAASALVSGSPYSITPSAAVGASFSSSNYNITYRDGTFAVNRAVLTINGETVSNKVYDGTTVATINTNGASLAGVVGSDLVYLSTNGVTGTFQSPNAASNIPVTIIGNTLIGTDASKYELAQPTGFIATISKAPLSITANNLTKTYGQTAALLSSAFGASGLKNGETVTSVTLASAGVAPNASVFGGPYAITPSNASGTFSASNYDITYINGVLTVDRAPLILSGTRVYNGTSTAANMTATGVLGQTFSVTGNGNITNLSSKNVGTYALSSVTGLTLGASSNGGDAQNYEPIATIGSIYTVTPAALSIRANSYQKTYGDTLTFSGSEFSSIGLQGTDTIGSVTLSSAGVAANASVIGGPYTITPSAAAGGTFAAGNYTLTYTNGTLNVVPAPLTLTGSQPYNGGTTVIASNLTAVGVLGQSFDVTGQGDASNLPSKNVGTYILSTVTGLAIGSSNNGGVTTNYVPIASATSNYAITPAALTITALNDAKTYGETRTYTGLEFTHSALQNGETLTGVTLNSVGASATAGVAASPYNIVPSLPLGVGFLPSNYAITYVNGQLTVNPAPLTVTANNVSKSYGQVLSTTGTAFTSSGLKNNETIGQVALNSLGNAATASVTGGPYVITSSAATGGTFDANNYTITYANGNLTVNPAPLTITANSLNKTYGQVTTLNATDFTPTGLQNAETVGAVSLSSTGTVATAAVNGGSPYNIIPFAATGGTFNPSNYAITYVNGGLTVNPAPLTITANSLSKTYGQVATLNATDFTPAGLQNAETVGAVSLSSTGAAATAAVNGGSPYNIIPFAATGGTFNPSNYAITYVNGGLTVNPAALVISGLQIYTGKTNAVSGALTATGVLGESFTLTGSGDSSNLPSGNVGNYTLTNVTGLALGTSPNGGIAGNYMPLSGVGSSIRIDKSTLTITANDVTKVYGQTVNLLGSAFTATGLLNGETIGSVALTSTGSSATASVTGSPYSIVPSSASGGNFVIGNYNINYVNGRLSVTPAPLTITANNLTKVYGDTLNLPSTSFTSDGLLNGEIIGNVTLSSAGASATASVSAGPYDIVPSRASGGSFVVTNYAINYVNGKLSLTPAPLTITANDVSKTYGQLLSVDGKSFTSMGLKNDDAISSVVFNSGGLAANASVLGGPYSLVPSGASGVNFSASNYAITYANGKLVVIPAPLTIKADDATKTFGEILNFAGTEFTVQGLLNGDILKSVKLSSQGALTTAVPNSSPYSILPSLPTDASFASSNYKITLVNGGLTVKPAPASVGLNALLGTLSKPALDTGFAVSTVHQVSNTEMARLAPMQVTMFTPEQIGSMTGVQVRSLSFEQLAQLSTDQLQALGPRQIQALTSTQLTALSPEQVSNLVPEQLSWMSSTQIGALDSKSLTTGIHRILPVSVLSNEVSETVGVAYEKTANGLTLELKQIDLETQPKTIKVSGNLRSFYVSTDDGQLVEFKGVLLGRRMAILAPSSIAKSMAAKDLPSILAAAFTFLVDDRGIALSALENVTIDLR